MNSQVNCSEAGAAVGGGTAEDFVELVEKVRFVMADRLPLAVAQDEAATGIADLGHRRTSGIGGFPLLAWGTRIVGQRKWPLYP